MTIETMIKSNDFYDKHKCLIDTTSFISAIIQIVVLLFFIIVPFIIFYKNHKLKNNFNERDKYIIKTLKLGEIWFGVCIVITYIAELTKYGYDRVLYADIFIIIISFACIGVVINKLLKKDDENIVEKKKINSELRTKL